MRSDNRLFFKSLWRPLQMMGVPEDYMLFIAFISVLTYPALSFIGRRILHRELGAPFWSIIVFLILLVYGRIRAKEDPEFSTVHHQKRKHLPKTKGGFKGNAYYPK